MLIITSNGKKGLKIPLDISKTMLNGKKGLKIPLDISKTMLNGKKGLKIPLDIKKHIEWKNTLKNDNNHHSLIPLYLHTLPESC